jgi:hypothetical protein
LFDLKIKNHIFLTSNPGIKKVRQEKLALRTKHYDCVVGGGGGGVGGIWPVSPPVSSSVVTCVPLCVVLLWFGHANARNIAKNKCNIVVGFKF